MHCPFCKSSNLRVLESRSADDHRSIRRRRECLECTQRFTTYERIELNQMIVTKRSGSKEVYSRDKLIASIVRSCSKAQISALTIDSIVDSVEASMYQSYNREIPSSALGEIVLVELKEVNPMAYIRYASVFKKINSIGEFVDEMKKIEDSMFGLEFEPQEEYV